MLSKLLKYEIPAIGRRMIPLYIAWAAASVLLGISLGTIASKMEFLGVISIMIYVLVTTAVFVVAAILIIQRFNSSLLGDEGYFSLALPVTASQHIANKTLSALLWVVATGVASALSFVIVCVCGGGALDVIHWIRNEFIPDMDWQVMVFLIELIVLGLISMVKSILCIYAAITVGHQANKRVWLVAIVAYIVFSTIESTIGWICIEASIHLNLPDFDLLHGFAESQLQMGFATLIVAALTIGYFFFCKYMMEKRLNLA